MKLQHQETFALLAQGRLVAVVAFAREIERGVYVMSWQRQGYVTGSSVIQNNIGIDDHIASLGIPYDMKVGYKW